MAFQKKLPLDIMRYILTFKDPTKQVGVKGGIKTDSARAMPLHADLIDNIHQEAIFPLPRKTMWINNGSEHIYHGEGQTKFVPHEPDCEGFNYIYIEQEYHRHFDLYYNAFDTRPCTQNPGYADHLIKPHSDLWLQCEACGPDLELYAQRTQNC